MNRNWVSATAAAMLASGAAAAPICERQSAAPPLVVELYTSEGCSSCPPADRWLSTLKGRSDVLALSFHVNYWDRLGWPDRFATPETTRRQYQWANVHGSRSVYTPQVVADGQDWRRWPALPQPAARGQAPQLKLTRQGGKVIARVEESAQAARWSGYWAVLEDQHASKVRAGENAGETLRHDHVVRHYAPVAPWNAAQGLSSELEVAGGVAEFPRRVAFVVADAGTQRPLQALALPLAPGC